MDLETWCQEQGRERGGVISLETCWRLAHAWYHDRLDRSWRRRTLEEAQALFDELGMTGEFWAL